jgi:hypothetical protein
MYLEKTELLPAFLVLLSAVILGAAVLFLGPASWLVPTLSGLAMAGYGSYRLYRGTDSKKWSTTSGTIQAASMAEYTVAESEYSRCTYYYPEVRYSYVVGDQACSGNRVAMDVKSIWHADRQKAEQLMAQYAAGRAVTVHFKPEKPEDSVLVPGLSSYRMSHYAAIAVGGLLVAGIGYLAWAFA